MLVQVGSALAIAAMVGLAAWLGFTAKPLVREAEARRLIAEQTSCPIAAYVVSERGDAALAALDDGRFALVRGLGDRMVIRVYAARDVRFSLRRRGLRVVFEDPAAEPVLLEGVHAVPGAPA